MKRIWTALILLALMLFFGKAGENHTHQAADRLGQQTSAVSELLDGCSDAAASAEKAVNSVKRIYDGWKSELDTLKLYMNSHNLTPVTDALREAKDAAAGGDMERLDSALIKLSYAIDDLRTSEDLTLGNVF